MIVRSNSRHVSHASQISRGREFPWPLKSLIGKWKIHFHIIKNKNNYPSCGCVIASYNGLIIAFWKMVNDDIKVKIKRERDLCGSKGFWLRTHLRILFRKFPGVAASFFFLHPNIKYIVAGFYLVDKYRRITRNRVSRANSNSSW